MKVIYRPEAEVEILESARFYQARADRLGEQFLAAINDHVLKIASSPERFPQVGRNIRQSVVQKFPFIIFFSVHPDQIRILAVAHTSRNPQYWKRRK